MTLGKVEKFKASVRSDAVALFLFLLLVMWFLVSGKTLPLKNVPDCCSVACCVWSCVTSDLSLKLDTIVWTEAGTRQLRYGMEFWVPCPLSRNVDTDMPGREKVCHTQAGSTPMGHTISVLGRAGKNSLGN